MNEIDANDHMANLCNTTKQNIGNNNFNHQSTEQRHKANMKQIAHEHSQMRANNAQNTKQKCQIDRSALCLRLLPSRSIHKLNSVCISFNDNRLFCNVEAQKGGQRDSQIMECSVAVCNRFAQLGLYAIIIIDSDFGVR